VAQVGVIGLPAERWGEAVTAIVVRREGAELTDDDVRDKRMRSGSARARCSRQSR